MLNVLWPGRTGKKVRVAVSTLAWIDSGGSIGTIFIAFYDLTISGCMGGEETIRKLREINPEVRAIVSSGYSNDPVMASFRDFGFSGIIAKPFRAGKLGQVLQQVIAGG